MNTEIAHLGTALASVLLLGFAFVSTASAQDRAAIQPQPSKAYPLAASGLILDIEDTGAGFVAVGERGHVLRSEDAMNWNQVIVPVDSLLTAVSFADEKNGWAVGHDGVILHSRDGGHHWELQRFKPKGAGPLLDVQFDTPQHGFAVGAFGTFLETQDGGKNWEAVEAAAVTDAAVHLYAINKFDTGRWVMVGEMGFIAMSDDGERWTQLDSPYDGSFYSIAQYGKAGAVIVGMRGNAFLSKDLSVDAWTTYQTDTVLSLTGVTRINPNEFLVTTLNRKLLVLDSAGSVRPLQLSKVYDDDNTGSFNDVVPIDGGLLLASDEGVIRAKELATELSWNQF